MLSIDMIKVDGSIGESGGQILRTALTLSSITQKPFEIFNIRAKRSPPGLKMQHLTAVKAVRSICRGKLEGAEEGSQTLKFFANSNTHTAMCKKEKQYPYNRRNPCYEIPWL